MRLILVRHGAAHAGLRGTIAGPSACQGLTDEGRAQAAALRDHIIATDTPAIDALVTSLIPRAIETAEIVAPAYGIADVTQRCDLCEVHTGVADGLDWDDYAARYGAFDMLAEPDRPFAPDGDSWNGFHRRVEGAMMRLATEYPDQTVMAVCHAGVIAASLRNRFGSPSVSDVRLVPTNTGLTEWEYHADLDTWTLRYYDRIEHLAAGHPAT